MCGNGDGDENDVCGGQATYPISALIRFLATSRTLHMNRNGACFDGYRMMAHNPHYMSFRGMDHIRLKDGFLRASWVNERRRHGTEMRRSMKAFCKLLMVGGDGGDDKRGRWLITEFRASFKLHHKAPEHVAATGSG